MQNAKQTKIKIHFDFPAKFFFIFKLEIVISYRKEY
jgi:hypothetical protein